MVSDANDFDPWGMPAGGFALSNRDNDSFHIETIENVEPLDRQFGTNPKKAVPDVLQEVMFGQLELTESKVDVAGKEPINASSGQTYAILDAAKVTNLPELLGASGLEHRCLFNGDAYDDLKNAAPWLARLEDGNDFTRRLFTGPFGINGLWEKEPGIYVRSSATLDDLWGHLRKFTRVQNNDGKWFYYRFWEPRWTTSLILDLPSNRRDQFLTPLEMVCAIRKGTFWSVDYLRT